MLKEKIANFLYNHLGLKLSEKKTLITNITKQPANFLGFELRISARGALHKTPIKDISLKKKFILSKKSGLLVWAQPDKQRLIDRLHMKGFCKINGFPTSIPWLSTLESNVIIQRFNDQIRGLAEYYLPNIRYKYTIIRWIYILRYSCLKTLAQKYKSSIKKIFKRFGHRMYSKASQTIKVTVTQKVRKRIYSKEWVLLTYKDLTRLIKSKEEAKALEKTFWAKENGTIGEYEEKVGPLPAITEKNFLDRISWVSWRTMASLDMPCASCGTHENVEQHHIKHVRKRAYSLIPQPENFKKIMALRNRKQIPLCVKCHRELVHSGQYQGTSLKKNGP